MISNACRSVDGNAGRVAARFAHEGCHVHAVINMKACAERLAARSKRLAQNPSAHIAAERTKQTLDAVAFKANLDVLKMANTKAKALLDIIA